MHTFETSGPPVVAIRAGAGEVVVTATDDATTTTVRLTPLAGSADQLVAETRVEQDGDTVVVDVPRSRWSLVRPNAPVAIEVACPSGATLQVQAESSDVRAHGRYADVDLASGSGSVTVGEVGGDARLRSGSGSVRAGDIGGSLTVTTGSGDVLVSHSRHRAAVTAGSGDVTVEELAGELVSRTGSGDVEVRHLVGDLRAKSGSGSLTVRRATAGSVVANGASGNVSIGIEPGTAAWLDVSTLTGSVRQELDESDPPGEDQRRLQVTAHTVSGHLRVHRS